MIAGHQLSAKLVAALGLPRNTAAFTLRARAGEVVTVECEYYPDDGGIVAALAEYGLVPRTKLAATPMHRAESIGFDAWLAERTEAAHQAMMAQVRADIGGA